MLEHTLIACKPVNKIYKGIHMIRIRSIWLSIIILCISAIAYADTTKVNISAKDIVLATLAGEITGYDGLKISILGMNKDGTTVERSTKEPFNSGERFQIRLLPSSDGTLTLSNTNPEGKEKVLLSQIVQKNKEVILPSAKDSAFEFSGAKGTEKLDIALVPNSVEEKTKEIKDIQLVMIQSVGSADYLVRPSGSGPINVSLTITHQ